MSYRRHLSNRNGASRLCTLLGAFLLCACSASSNLFKSTPSYYPTAQQNYEYGLKELKAGNWQAAQQYFQHVRSQFGFSKYATLAELGLADTNLGREKFIEAVDGYKQFIKAHPAHERVQDGYAAFKVGEAYHREIPGSWLLAPPTYEKDQGPVVDALRELTTFLETYADSPYAGTARKLRQDCIRRLAEHELYVAKFYLDRGHPYAAIARLEGLVERHPEADQEPDTLLLLGRTYLKMDKNDEARQTFTRLMNEHPADYRAKKAQLYIQFIDKKVGKK